MPKVLAERGAWFARAVAALSGGGCDEVVVVLGAAVVDVPAPARAVIAPDWRRAGRIAAGRAGRAPGGGLRRGADRRHPDIGADVVARVLGAARRAPSGIARATYGGRPGHPSSSRAGTGLHSPTTRGAGFLAGRADVAAVDCADLATGADIDTR